MSSRSQNLVTRGFGSRVNQSHYILQLIAKAKGATRLIEGRPAAHSTGERLISQPSIHERVHRSIGCFYRDGGEQLVPERKHAFKRFVNLVSVPESRVYPASFFD